MRYISPLLIKNSSTLIWITYAFVMLTIMVCGPHNQHVNNSEQQRFSQTVPLLTKNHIDCNFNDGMDVDQFLVSFTFLSWKCYQIKSNILRIVGKDWQGEKFIRQILPSYLIGESAIIVGRRSRRRLNNDHYIKTFSVIRCNNHHYCKKFCPEIAIFRNFLQ